MYLVCQHVCLSVPAAWPLFTLLPERIARGDDDDDDDDDVNVDEQHPPPGDGTMRDCAPRIMLV